MKGLVRGYVSCQEVGVKDQEDMDEDPAQDNLEEF